MRRSATAAFVASGGDLEALRGELEAIRAEVREVRQLLLQAAVPRSNRLSRRDRERLGRILPAVAGVFGPELFAVREVFTHGAPALRIVLENETPKALGRLFGRAAGVAIDGLVTRAEGSELNARLWRVWRVD